MDECQYSVGVNDSLISAGLESCKNMNIVAAKKNTFKKQRKNIIEPKNVTANQKMQQQQKPYGKPRNETANCKTHHPEHET